jgi:DNA-binding Lrp family transcriptional regulator
VQVISETDKTILEYMRIQKRIAPNELAVELKIDYFTIYYHIKKLERYGKIKRILNNYKLSEETGHDQ